MEVSDLLISTVRDIRSNFLQSSEDGAEPAIAALTKDVNKHPEFEGQKISQAMVSLPHVWSLCVSKRLPTLRRLSLSVVSMLRVCAGQEGVTRNQAEADGSGSGSAGPRTAAAADAGCDRSQWWEATGKPL